MARVAQVVCNRETGSLKSRLDCSARMRRPFQSSHARRARAWPPSRPASKEAGFEVSLRFQAVAGNSDYGIAVPFIVPDRVGSTPSQARARLLSDSSLPRHIIAIWIGQQQCWPLFAPTTDDLRLLIGIVNLASAVPTTGVVANLVSRSPYTRRLGSRHSDLRIVSIMCLAPA